MSRARGFTLIELLVVTSAVALLFGIALDRLLRYKALGERAAVEQTVAAMNTALSMKFAAYVVMGRPRGIEAEVGTNPIALLARPPENYLGELDAPDAESLPRGTWYFDRQSADLVYLPERGRYLGSEPPVRLRFRIALTEVHDKPDGVRQFPQPFIASAPPLNWKIE